ncbi:hypothetical protein MTO96_024472 [Rhipicephalus appendiculatus]
MHRGPITVCAHMSGYTSARKKQRPYTYFESAITCWPINPGRLFSPSTLRRSSPIARPGPIDAPRGAPEFKDLAPRPSLAECQGTPADRLLEHRNGVAYRADLI